MLFILLPFSIPNAFGQTVINVTETTPCFLNQTASVSEMLDGCDSGRDWLDWTMSPWQWITGGFFIGLILGVIIIGTYLAFGKALYAMIVGITLMPTAFYFFPPSFISFAVIMAFVAIGLLIAYIYVKQTKT